MQINSKEGATKKQTRSKKHKVIKAEARRTSTRIQWKTGNEQSGNMACWNIRGDTNHKQIAVRELVKKRDLNLIGLLDTKVQERKVTQILNNSLLGWQCEHNYMHNDSCKLWVCWRSYLVTVRCIRNEAQCITMEATLLNGGVFLIKLCMQVPTLSREENYGTH